MRSNSKKLVEMVATLNDIIEQTYYFEQKVFEWAKKVESNKSRINKAMGRKEKIDINVDDEVAFRATKQVKTNIDFFADKLKTALNKDLFNKVTTKTVTVNDLDGLVKFLKEYKVPPKEFKNFITVSAAVDVNKIDELIETEEIKIEDIQGCYDVSYEEEIKVIKTK